MVIGCVCYGAFAGEHSGGLAPDVAAAAHIGYAEQVFGIRDGTVLCLGDYPDAECTHDAATDVVFRAREQTSAPVVPASCGDSDSKTPGPVVPAALTGHAIFVSCERWKQVTSDDFLVNCSSIDPGDLLPGSAWSGNKGSGSPRRGH
jgi:hypothetical protein